LRLSLAEREELSLGLQRGESRRCIAARLGRSPSTICREVNHNGGPAGYRAWRADRRAVVQARRPKPAKLAVCSRLRAVVEDWLELRWSPQQIATMLAVEFPDEPEMRVSHETIYQSLFVQGRGALRKELTVCLRSGRTRRRPHTPAATRTGRGRIPDMVMISERPAEVADRAVPGHWEGDLLIGKDGGSAIATLVERSTRYVMLLALPHGRNAEAVRDALTVGVQRLPTQLWRSLTWDQGAELAQHRQFQIDTGIDVYFCDPHSPWQRGSNENTNGLLRQYFPKGTSLRGHSQDHLDAVAAQLNGRPRQTLGWMKPSEKLAELVAMTA
jgi:IS30 family transposase